MVIFILHLKIIYYLSLIQINLQIQGKLLMKYIMTTK